MPINENYTIYCMNIFIFEPNHTQNTQNGKVESKYNYLKNLLKKW